MIRIDGSRGEGGGQVLRSALTLSILTGQSVRVDNIRAGRRKPGLMAQHLKAVEAAVAVSRGRSEGARFGSTTLIFAPGAVRPGEYRFDIGTAGSTSLVLQTVLLPLAMAAGGSRVVISGGTHVPWSPCFHYLDLVWVPALRRLGLDVRLQMARAGFYPRGGGLISAEIRPGGLRHPLRLTERGRLQRLSVLSMVANLDPGIAERQAHRARERLCDCGISVAAEQRVLPSPGRGTVLLLLAEFEHGRCCYYALGERGKPAERVADEAAEALLVFLDGPAAVDEHLADQMLLPLALTPGRSELRTAHVTRHLLTNVRVIGAFLPAAIVVAGKEGAPGLVRVDGTPLGSG